MTIRQLRFTLSGAQLPFISTQQPRAVISPDLDSSGRVPRPFFASEVNLDYNTCTALYVENVVPTIAGWRSVRYTPAVPRPSAERAGLPTSGYQQYQQLQASDPAGTARTAATFATPVITESEVCQLLSQRTGAEYKLVQRFPAAYTASGFDVTWRQVVARHGATTVSVFPVLLNSPGISIAYVQGVQLICIPGFGISYFGATLNGTVASMEMLVQVCTTDDTRTPATGYTNNSLIANLPFKMAEISCIWGSQGYLCVASKNEIAWAVWDGVRFDFADFANNELTGSGVRIPEGLQGSITAGVEVPGGFIMFSAKNAIASSYSSANAGTPWIFRSIANSGGVRNVEYVSRPDETGGVNAYTSAGLQIVTLNSAKDVLTAANDFLMGKRQETYDAASKTLSSAALVNSFFAKVRMVGYRYLVVSYGSAGANTFGYALVYDTSLQRWGKIKYAHVDALNFFTSYSASPLTIGSLSGVTFGDLATTRISELVSDPEQQITRGRQMLALLTPQGEIVSVVMDDSASDDNATLGVVILGKIQASRNKLTALHRITLEGMETGGAVTVCPSTNGRTSDRNVPYTLTESGGDYAQFAGIETGQNHTVIVEGQFHLSSFLVDFDTEGQL